MGVKEGEPEMRYKLILWLCLLPVLMFPAAAGASSVELVVSANTDAGRSIVSRAEDYLGVPYVYAGASMQGVDCSGLVYCVYRDVFDERLPRGVAGLMEAGRPVEGTPAPGDLVFFDTTGGPSHVGISLGGDRFIHAASEGPHTGVIVSSLTKAYYNTRYLGARRYIEGVPSFVRIGLDDEPAAETVRQPLVPGLPVSFGVVNRRSAGSWVTLSFFQDSQFVLSKRVRSKPGHAASEVWFVPSRGRWTVRLSDGDGQPLLELGFVAQ